MSPNAPRVEAVMIDPENIGAIIGTGGSVIKEMIQLGAKMGGPLEIDIDDSGRVMITAAKVEQMDFVKGRIKEITMEPELGEIYDGIVDSVMPYRAFVDVAGGAFSGLVHVSEMSDKFVDDPSTIVKEGQEVKVKLMKSERGKLSFTMKLDSKPGEQSDRRPERRSNDRSGGRSDRNRR